MKQHLYIGTRGSTLALWQANWVAQQLSQYHPESTFEIVTFKTEGDKRLDISLQAIGSKGIFTDEIERALQDGSIDIAVHSLKDLPTELAPGLAIGAYCKREDPRDVFIGKRFHSLHEVPDNACIGTSSLRRTAQVLQLRPTVRCVDMRGNVDTRLQKLAESSELEGIILAAAGLIRLGKQACISEYLDDTAFLPAPGQGVIALEICSSNERLAPFMESINHLPSEHEARAERAFLAALDGGCHAPIGARARYENGELSLCGMVASLDGAKLARVTCSSSSHDALEGHGSTEACARDTQASGYAERLGIRAAKLVLQQGAADILAEITDSPAKLEHENKGFVSLVGAGPGDAELLTLKGKRVLEQAEVLIYDRLINESILQFAPPSCELIYVGKAPGKHYLKQEEINALLVKKAQLNKYVVRLKGGDPFVFGRGGEEALALQEAGIPFEIVPGVSSAIAAAAYAGIPVTHRGLASSFTVITGHEDPTKDSAFINWEQLAASSGTLVFLMGMTNLELIVKQLLHYNKPASTQVALVERGTSAEQRTVTGTLATIAAVAKQEGIGNPALIIVGEVVTLRDALSWYEQLPLFGQHVLVTRARSQASKLSLALRKLGASVTELPLIAFAPPTSLEPLKKAIEDLAGFGAELSSPRAVANRRGSKSKYNWLIFTSVNGVEAFFEELFSLGHDVRALAGLKLVAVGSATKEALESKGLRNIIMPKEYCAEGIIAELDKHLSSNRLASNSSSEEFSKSFASDLSENVPEESLDQSLNSSFVPEQNRVLLVRAEDARETLPLELEKRGFVVDDVAAYKTIAAPLNAEELLQALNAGTYTGISFTSSSTVHKLMQAVGKDHALLSNIALYSIGPITSKTLREYGFEPTVEAQPYTIEGLVEAITKELASSTSCEQSSAT